MEKSLNFEIVKNTNLEKFYGYLKNDEIVFNDKRNNSIIFIDCRKILEYSIKEMIFSKSGISAYEEAGNRSLKGNINYIKEMIPKTMFSKLEYIRFAGNKYAHEVDSSFDVLNCLKYTYEFIVWYLKNIEKKLPMTFNEEFKVPNNIIENTEIKKEVYSFNEEELKKEILEMKEKLKISKKEREEEIKELEKELKVYKDKVSYLEEQGKNDKEKMLALKKMNADPLITLIEETIDNNKEIFGVDDDVASVVKAEEILNGVRENLNYLGEMFKIMNDTDKLYEMANVEKINNEYKFLNKSFRKLDLDDLILTNIITEDIKNKNYKLIKKNSIFLSMWLNGEKKKCEKFTREDLINKIEDNLRFIVGSKKKGLSIIELSVNMLHKKIFKDVKEDEVYLIDIFNIYMDEAFSILKNKFRKSGSIKKVILFTKIMGSISSEDTIVMLNTMKKHYNREDIGADSLATLDIETLGELLKGTRDLREYTAISRLILNLLDGFGYKKEKRFKIILKNLKEKGFFKSLI